MGNPDSFFSPHQSLIFFAQIWLNGAKTKTAAEIKLYSLVDVQRAIEVIEVQSYFIIKTIVIF